MVHLKNLGYIPADAPALLSKADQLTAGMHAIIRDMRVSSKYLEFDVSVDKVQLDALLDKLQPIGSVDHARQIVEEKIEKEEAMLIAKEYFNDERFWECHEVLEGVWKKTYEGEKDLVQGTIHYQKNEDEICLSILKRAIEKLTGASGKYYGIDVDLFRKTVSDMIGSKKIATFKI